MTTASKLLYSCYKTKAYGTPGADVDLVADGGGNNCRVVSWTGGDLVVVNEDTSEETLPEHASPWPGQFITMKAATTATSIVVGW